MVEALQAWHFKESGKCGNCLTAVSSDADDGEGFRHLRQIRRKVGTHGRMLNCESQGTAGLTSLVMAGWQGTHDVES